MPGVPEELRRLLVGLAGLDLGDLGLEVAVGREQVEPAVEVVVEEEQAELQRRLGRGTEAVEVGQVGELEARRLVGDVEGGHLVGEVADGQAERAVVLEVGPVDAHRRRGASPTGRRRRPR